MKKIIISLALLISSVVATHAMEEKPAPAVKFGFGESVLVLNGTKRPLILLATTGFQGAEADLLGGSKRISPREILLESEGRIALDRQVQTILIKES